MNVCFLCREYPPAPRVGGIGWATRDQACTLATLGHRVHVVAPAWDGPATVDDDDGVVVHRIEASRMQIPGVARVTGQTLDRLGWSRAAATTVSRIHRGEGLDVVEAPEFAAEGLLSTLRRRPPVVVRLHTPLALVRRFNGTPPRFDCRLTMALERAAVARADALTAPSRAIVSACLEAGYRGAGNASIIPYGIDVDLFRPRTGAANGHAPLVLFVGRLEARKGVGDLIAALPTIAQRMPEARFAFVGADTMTAPGGGSWREYMRARVGSARLDERVRFEGVVRRDELPRWYRSADVVVAPSPFENLAVVFLEAAACGRPVVGCSTGAFPELVTDGVHGRAVPANDPPRLADAVVGLLEDPSAAELMGTRARERILERFSLQKIASRSADMYAEVAAARRQQ